MPNEVPDYRVATPADNTQAGAVDTIVNVVPALAPPPGLVDIPAAPPGTYYVAAGINVTYHRDYGIRGATLAAAKDAAELAFWRVHTGRCVKVVTWYLELLGGPPTIPNPVINPNEVLIEDLVSIPHPVTYPDGKRSYKRIGQYCFLLQRMPSTSDYLYGCTVPVCPDVVTQNVVNPNDYLDLLGPTTPPLNYSGRVISF